MGWKAMGCAIAALLVVQATTSRAESAGDFYKGKTVELYIGYSAGGGYDTYARLLARYLGKHIPGHPTVVPKNMAGAASLKLANWLYNVAPKDGTAFGTISRGVPFDKLLGRPGIQFEATKFSWIGSANDEVSVCVAMRASGVKTFNDLKTREIVVGAAGASSDDDQFPRVINAALGTKMHVVSGYPGGNEVALAMERGEVSGRCGWSWSSLKSSQSSWLKENKINILAQLGLSKHPDLPNVPSIMEFAKTDQQRKILNLIFVRQSLGRPFVAPPGVPADRLAVLRKAFMDTLKDPELVAEAERSKIEINPLTGEQVEDLVRHVYADTSPDIVKRVADILR